MAPRAPRAPRARRPRPRLVTAPDGALQPHERDHRLTPLVALGEEERQALLRRLGAPRARVHQAGAGPFQDRQGLQPFLAAAGHVVVMRADGTTSAHEHAEIEDGRGRPVFAVPGTTFGPKLDVHAQ